MSALFATECTAIVLDENEIVYPEAQNQSASGSRSEAMGIKGSSGGSLDGHSGRCPSEIGTDTSNYKSLIHPLNFQRPVGRASMSRSRSRGSSGQSVGDWLVICELLC